MIPAVALALDALRRGDPTDALRATRDVSDPVVLVLRGIASAEMGEHTKARALVTEAAHAFEARGDVLLAERARLAEASIALADYGLDRARRSLAERAVRLEVLDDQVNCAWAFVLAARAASLQGDKDAARSLLAECAKKTGKTGVPHVHATLAILDAELALRDKLPDLVESTIASAKVHALASKNPTLITEVEAFEAALVAPIALLSDGTALAFGPLARLCRATQDQIVIDGVGLRIWLRGEPLLDLASSPGLFDVLMSIGRAGDVGIDIAELVRRTSDPKTSKSSATARLRTEVDQARAILPIEGGRISRTRSHVRWKAPHAITVVTPFAARWESRLRAFLADGHASSIQAIAKTIGATPKAVQHLVSELRAKRVLRTFGSGKFTRYALESGTERIVSRMLLLGLIADG